MLTHRPGVWTEVDTQGMGRTMRHLAGINIGFPLMLVTVGLSAGAIFRQYSWLQDGLQVIGAVYRKRCRTRRRLASQ